jgi:hypothetical protein
MELVPTQTRIRWTLATISAVVKQQERDNSQLPRSSAMLLWCFVHKDMVFTEGLRVRVGA